MAIVDILIDDRFKRIIENNNSSVSTSLETIEKIFNEISKKTAADVTTEDMKQIVGALQNFSATANDKNVLVVDGTNVLDVANILGRKVAAREKYNAEQNQQTQQPQQQTQPENGQTNTQNTEESQISKADTSAILKHLNNTKDILVKKLNSQKNDSVKSFLTEVIKGIDEAITAANALNGEVNNNSTPSNL